MTTKKSAAADNKISVSFTSDSDNEEKDETSSATSSSSDSSDDSSDSSSSSDESEKETSPVNKNSKMTVKDSNPEAAKEISKTKIQSENKIVNRVQNEGTAAKNGQETPVKTEDAINKPKPLTKVQERALAVEKEKMLGSKEPAVNKRIEENSKSDYFGKPRDSTLGFSFGRNKQAKSPENTKESSEISINKLASENSSNLKSKENEEIIASSKPAQANNKNSTDEKTGTNKKAVEPAPIKTVNKTKKSDLQEVKSEDVNKKSVTPEPASATAKVKKSDLLEEMNEEAKRSSVSPDPSTTSTKTKKSDLKEAKINEVNKKSSVSPDPNSTSTKTKKADLLEAKKKKVPTATLR